MPSTDLATFHETSRALDFRGPLTSLLDAFRRGHFADRARAREASALASHLAELRVAWDRVFPAFPACPWTRRTLTWEHHRGERDAYLRRLIIAYVPADDTGRHLIVNPAAVAGRHARMLARALPACKIVATDIDPRGDRLYRLLGARRLRGLTNYRFARESVFEPDLGRRPAAVVFFGACGVVTDGCMDYARAVRSPFLICRSCCHDNIGGNMKIAIRPRPINAFFLAKNGWFAWVRRWGRGSYFSDRYGPDAYPRSRAARACLDTATLLAIARHSPNSDICRSIIDLDRCLYLRENGYDVLYREELFFAHKRPGPPHPHRTNHFDSGIRS
jgi:hypothetical protein